MFWSVRDREMLCGALWCLGGMLTLALVYAAMPSLSVRLLWGVIILSGAIPFLLRSQAWSL